MSMGWRMRAGVMVVALCVPGPAMASDFRGFLSGIIILTFGLPFMLANLVVLALQLLGGQLRSRNVALTHTLVAGAWPVLGFAAMFLEGRTVPPDGIALRLAFNSVAMACAMLPLAIHRLKYGSRVPKAILFDAERVDVAERNGLTEIRFVGASRYLLLRTADKGNTHVEVDDESRACVSRYRDIEVRADQFIVRLEEAVAERLDVPQWFAVRLRTTPLELKALRAAAQRVMG